MALVDSPIAVRSYHSVQLAIIIGLFACGGLLCSFFFLDGSDDFPPPHHWLRQSYSSPVMTLPPPTPGARVVPQNVLLRPNHQDKSAASQRRRMPDRKLASSANRTDGSTYGFRPANDLRTKWTNFSANLRDRAVSLDLARGRALDFGRRLRQHCLEARRAFVRKDTGGHTDDAG
jgi:hypothetical protein